MPHLVIARLWGPIDPMERGDRFEDPLNQFLEEKQLGRVTGGGSLLTEEGEIHYAELELELANLDDALDTVAKALDLLGAPAGSELEFERNGSTEQRPVGVAQCLAIYLDGTGLPDEVYATADIDALANEIDEAVAPANGAIRGSWAGPTETSIYIYGPDAEAMLTQLEPLLRRVPLCQNARVVIRHGRDTLAPRTVKLPMW